MKGPSFDDVIKIELQDNVQHVVPKKFYEFLFAFCCATDDHIAIEEHELKAAFCQVKALLNEDSELRGNFIKLPVRSTLASELYVPFSEACNYAFQALAKLSCRGMPDLPTHQSIAMIVREYETLAEEHDNDAHHYGSKLDVCIASLSAHDTDLKWRDVLCPVEVKPNPGGCFQSHENTWFSTLDDQPMRDSQSNSDSNVVSNVADDGGIKDKVVGGTTQSSGGIKRKCSQTEEDLPKRPKVDSSPPLDDATTPQDNQQGGTRNNGGENEAAQIRLACYAALRMSSAFDITHTVGMLLVGRKISISWFDRQGAIRSHFFDICENLPHFVLFLLILQRFSLASWGYAFAESALCTTTPDVEDPPLIASLTIPSKPTFHFQPQGDVIHKSTMLVGRGTWVIGGSKTRELANMAELPHHVKAEKHPYVLKLSWPEVSCPSEITILEKIEEICQEEADSDLGKCIIGHVPVIEAHLDPTFPGSNTGFIRKFLFGESGVGAARQMRWIVFERFQPLSTLPEQQMVQGYVETFLCHRALWMKGVHHCDISPENLLWHPRRKAGVLNDFDLSKLKCNLNLASGPIENIGTLPFMALDLLSADGLEGKIKRLYRHNAEAFTWSLTYICLNHTLEGNKIVINTKHPLSRWFSDIDTILSSKPGILRDDWKKIEPHATAYPQAQSLAKKLVLYYLNRLSSQRRIENQASAQSDDVEFKPQRTPHLVASLGGDVAEGATSEVNPVIYKEKPDSEHFAENVWSILKWLDSEEQRLRSSLEGDTNASEYYGAKWTELSDTSALLVPHSGSAHKSL